MNSEKQVMRYEISSDDEDDHNQELAQDHDSTIMIGGGTIKRSYDCTFCKRGFTNAQALGGHMNIHRKDRARSKQVITPNNNSSSSSLLLQNTTNEEEFMVLPNFSSEFSNQFPTRNYSILESQRNNCDMSSYFHQPPPSSNSYLGNQYAHGFQYHHEVHNNLRSQPVNFNDEFGGANLSLQIGPSHVDNAKGTQKNGEVDLELRLGHDPC